jgi:diguanylate cyclase (GGDEF)-like protein/PAS domain S-box-containing protein
MYEGLTRQPNQPRACYIGRDGTELNGMNGTMISPPDIFAAKILIADDQKSNVLLIELALRDAGYSNITSTMDSREVCELHREHRYDLILLDLQMPNLDGFQVMEALKSIDEHGYLPVIVLTAEPGHKLRALQAGAKDFISKPFDLAEIKTRIRNMLEVRLLYRELEQQNLTLEQAVLERTANLRESEELFRQLANNLPEALWLRDLDGKTVLYVNPASERVTGWPIVAGDPLSKIFDTVHPDDRDRARAESRKSPTGGMEIDCRILRPDGVVRWVHVRTFPITNADGYVYRVAGVMADITERKRAEVRMALLERAMQSSMNGVIIVDAKADDLPILYVNPAFERMTGYGAAEVIGRNCRFLQSEDPDQPELDQIRHCVRSNADCDVVLRNYRKDGSLFWNHLFIAPVRDDHGEVSHFVGIQNDVTERRRAEAELSFTASHDAVTGLPRFLSLELDLAAMLDDPAALVWLYYISLDRFRAVNESMGHIMGDDVLQRVAQRLLDVVGDAGQVAHFAGDEFVAIAAGLDGAAALALAERLRATVAEPIEGDDYRVLLTASIGVSRSPAHGQRAQDLLRHAEAAMERAKRQGRDAVCEFSTDQMQDLEDRLTLGTRLRGAVRLGELELHYQPQYRASDRRLTGFEALLRWTSRELGRVSPARFIPIAEALGLMPEIGEWVLHEACRQARAWLDRGFTGFNIAVNISAQQLQRTGLVEQVRDAIGRYRIPPDVLDIELTESSLMENVARMQGTLVELKALGTTLSLDDFGTGYSSLAYLKQFPIDKLKIDQSFVKGLPDSTDDAAIARTIIAMSHQLRLMVSAEGVETEAQAEFLSQMGCDELQGYHLGRPVTAAEAEAFFIR